VKIHIRNRTQCCPPRISLNPGTVRPAGMGIPGAGYSLNSVFKELPLTLYLFGLVTDRMWNFTFHRRARLQAHTHIGKSLIRYPPRRNGLGAQCENSHCAFFSDLRFLANRRPECEFSHSGRGLVWNFHIRLFSPSVPWRHVSARPEQSVFVVGRQGRGVRHTL